MVPRPWLSPRPPRGGVWGGGFRGALHVEPPPPAFDVGASLPRENKMASAPHGGDSWPRRRACGVPPAPFPAPPARLWLPRGVCPAVCVHHCLWSPLPSPARAISFFPPTPWPPGHPRKAASSLGFPGQQPGARSRVPGETAGTGFAPAASPGSPVPVVPVSSERVPGGGLRLRAPQTEPRQVAGCGASAAPCAYGGAFPFLEPKVFSHRCF